MQKIMYMVLEAINIEYVPNPDDPVKPYKFVPVFNSKENAQLWINTVGTKNSSIIEIEMTKE